MLTALLLQRRRDLRGGLLQVPLVPVVVGHALEQRDRVAVRRAVLQADDREPAHGLVVVGGREPVQQRAGGVDRARRVAREELERDQRRAAAGRALVVEPALEQLDLLAEAELPDRAVGDGAFAVVGAAGIPLDLVVPLPPQVGELALLALLREGVGLGRCLLEGQATPWSERGAGPT